MSERRLILGEAAEWDKADRVWSYRRLGVIPGTPISRLAIFAAPIRRLAFPGSDTGSIYCPLPAPEGRVDAAGAAADGLTGSTNNWPVTEVPGISVSFAGWPDLASAMVML
jgi:hypothetical protein